VTGLEPATSGVTGRRSNQLSYTRVFGVGGDLGSGLVSVNHGGLHFLPLLDLFLVGLPDMRQSAMFEQETGDVGRARGRKNGLDNDE
jgi:hypothetical protein